MYRREDSGKAISRIRWSDDGRKILAGGANGSLRLYHVGEEGTVDKDFVATTDADIEKMEALLTAPHA